MSLPKSLYEPYRQLCQCALVQTREVTDENLSEFETLLNSAQPNAEDHDGNVQRNFLKSIYYSGTNSFARYLKQPASHVGALILWTESRRIVQFFNLQRLIHVSWHDDAYHVTKFVELSERGGFRGRGRGSFRGSFRGRGSRGRGRGGGFQERSRSTGQTLKDDTDDTKDDTPIINESPDDDDTPVSSVIETAETADVAPTGDSDVDSDDVVTTSTETRDPFMETPGTHRQSWADTCSGNN